MNFNGVLLSMAVKKLNKAELVLPFGMFPQIKECLFQDLSKEQVCYLLCGHTIIGSTLRLLSCYLVIPDESDYVGHSRVSVKIKQEFLVNILKECERLKLSLIDIHSHPFSTDSVAFSGTDEVDENEKAEWFRRNLPDCYFGSIVMGTNSHQSRIYLPGVNKLIEKPLLLKTLEIPLKTANCATSFNNEIYDRQLRAFGKEGQKAIANATFGIVGLGGLGAGLAIGLARLGAKHFKLIDFDKAKAVNLNRIDGMTRIDAELKTYKVDLVKRNLLEIDPDIKCETSKAELTKRDSWRKLRDVDVIVTATDNHASRWLLNIVSQLYLIPQVSVGTLISTEDGKLEDGHGHVYTMLPGNNQPCVLCAEIINLNEVHYEMAPRASRIQAAKSGYIQNFDEPAPAVVHLNGVIINLALIEIHNLFCGFKPLSKHLVYSMLEQEVSTILESGRNCATCSQGGGFFGRGDLVPDPMADWMSVFQSN